MKKVELQKVKRRRKKNFLSLFPAGLFSLAVIFLVLRYSPDQNLTLWSINIPVLPIFVLLFSLTIFFLVSFLVERVHGVILSGFFLIYVFLSIIHLNSIFFLVLLIVLFIIAEAFIYKKK